MFVKNPGAITIANSTIVDNTSQRYAGGIYQNGIGPVTIRNTILQDCTGTIISDKYNLVEDLTGCTFTPDATDIIGSDPLLAALANNGGDTETHALLEGSPAFDVIPIGTNGCGTTYTTDQRGMVRPTGPGCDIGAYEDSAAVADADDDGVLDEDDNCVDVPNPGQEDYDTDGLGDACDPDDDNDGVDDVDDAFPFDPTESSDNDGDGVGDNADPDDDNDGQTDADELTCGSDPMDGGSLSPDNDVDNSPDCVDPDDDNDGVDDGGDNCPLTYNPEQEDFDQDGLGDACDPDDDDDGVADEDDAYPYSDMSEAVCIGDCDSEVANQVLEDGSTFMDLINTAAEEANNHGDFVSTVTQLADQWKKGGLISGREKGKITSCAAHSDIPAEKPGKSDKKGADRDEEITFTFHLFLPVTNR